ncbi:MAG: hypothetical protein ACYTGP_10300 [Planctomycetota bacterium]
MITRRTCLLSLLGFATTVAGCSPSTGPVPLRSVRQMKRFLGGATYRDWIPADALFHMWRFHADGRFELWVEGPNPITLYLEIGHRALPEDARRISGRWDATKTELTLSEVTAADGTECHDMEMGLLWVDGKMRIDIDERRYRSTPRRR